METNPEMGMLELFKRRLKKKYVGLMTNMNSCEMMGDCSRDMESTQNI